MARQIKVLSIDGGGVRGIIPAMILAEIEKRTQKPVSNLFDLIAGTSTGGILALGLTKPDPQANPIKPQYSANELIVFYETEGANIFSRTVWHRIRSVGCIKEEKYPSEGIETVLEKYFGEARLKEALTPVLIASYEIERRYPFLFKSETAKKDPAYDFPIKEVARATSAAPTYFKPCKIVPRNSSDYYALIDGGVFANNPAMCGYVEATCIYPDADDFLMVSLGTGVLTRVLPYEEVENWGLAQWVQPILNVVLHGVNDTVDYQLGKLLAPAKDGRQRYYRFQIRLTEGNDDMDDASRTNLRVLKLLAESIIRDHANTRSLDILCGQLCE